MKLTKEALKAVIKEELNKVLTESYEDYEDHPLYLKILEIDHSFEDELDSYIDENVDDWESDYIEEVDSMGLEAVANMWIEDHMGGNTGDPLAKKAAQDRRDSEGYTGLEEGFRQQQPVQAMDFTPEQQRVIDHYAKLMKTRKRNQVNFYEMQAVIRRILDHKSFKGAGLGKDASADYKLIQNALKSAGYTGRTYIF